LDAYYLRKAFYKMAVLSETKAMNKIRNYTMNNSPETKLVTFKSFLEFSGLNPAKVKLARHRDTAKRAIISPYEVWRSNSEAFLLYNKIQGPMTFQNAEFIASFVVTPSGQTVFAEIFKINDVGEVPELTHCPVTGENRHKTSSVFYNLDRTEYLEEYKGRLVVDWGPGNRSWVQNADGKRHKPIVEIHRHVEEQMFPGFEAFCIHLSELNGLPATWKSVLQSNHGVYLLAHVDTGKIYVGAAHGHRGFLGRWEEYAKDGHGGNKELIKLKSSNFRISILKVCSSSASTDDVLQDEANWKKRLCSRSLGLNAN
jgi:hypothetical protein